MVNGQVHHKDNKVWVVIVKAITMKDMVHKVATRDLDRVMVNRVDMASRVSKVTVHKAVMVDAINKVVTVHKVDGKVAREIKVNGTRASKVVMVEINMAVNPAIGAIVVSHHMAADNHLMDRDHRVDIWAAATWVDMEAAVRMITMDKVVADVHSMVAVATMVTRVRWADNTATRVIADRVMVATRDMVASQVTRAMARVRVMDNKV